MLRAVVPSGCKKLKNSRSSFFQKAHAVEDAAFCCMADEPLGWLVERFVAETEGSEMHRDKSFCLELDECVDGLLRVHVDIALCRGVVGSDWQEGNFHRQALAYFAKAIEIGAVATVKNRPPGILDVKAPEAAVRVVEHAGPPMAGRGERDLQSAEFKGLPVLQLLHMVESKTMDEAADILRNEDGLVAGHGTQRLAVQMVKMGMCDQHKVNGWQVVDFHAGLLDALDNFQPFGPVGIDEHAVLGSLNEERGMADPSDADLPMLKLGKDRLHATAFTLGKQGGNHDLREEIPLVPSAAELHVHMVLGLASCGDFSLDELSHHA
jgi:hypothetical protein